MFRYLLLFLLIFSIQLGFADSDGVWHYAKDVRGGIFAHDEDEKDFSFVGLVTFNNNAYFMSNVGIGTTTPSSKLDVVGTINVSSIYDRENNAYYVDPNGISTFNDVIVSILRDFENLNYYVDPTANSRVYRLHADDIRSKIFYDWDNSVYYIDPNNVSKISRLQISSRLNCDKVSTNSVGELICATDNVNDGDYSSSNEIQNLDSVLSQGNNANNKRIVGLLDPLNPQDAATKSYVDNNAGSSFNEPPICTGVGKYLQWDGTNWDCFDESSLPTSCKAILDSGGSTGSGIYTIYSASAEPIQVYCDMTTAGGGWTRIAFAGNTGDNSIYSSTAWTNGIGSGDSPTTPGHISKAFFTLRDYTQVAFLDGLYAGGGDISGCWAGKSLYEKVLDGGTCSTSSVSGITQRTLYFNQVNSCGKTKISSAFHSYDGGTSYYYWGAGEEGSYMYGSCYGAPAENAGSLYVR